MEKPRFRRWLGYNYLPLNLSGWLMIAAFFLVEMLISGAWFQVEAETPIWWALAVLGFSIFLAFWTFVHRNSG